MQVKRQVLGGIHLAMKEEDMRSTPKIIAADDLPDDPLRMPPPYWRTGGAVFQVADALEHLVSLLTGLPELNDATRRKLDEHFAKYPSEADLADEEALEEFSEICDSLWELEHKIKLKAELVILMTAISAEELLNEFCVYNLPKELGETLERLSPAEKLTAAASSLGKRRVRGTAAYQAISALSAWRNAFAHGHCVDRPLKTLRHNHLIGPGVYPGVPESIRSMLDLTEGYFRLAKYLSGIAINPYTKGKSVNWATIRKMLESAASYEFRGGANTYEVTVS